MENKGLAMVIIIAITILVGVTFMAALTDTTEYMRTPATITNETLNISSARDVTDARSINASVWLATTNNNYTASSVSVALQNGTEYTETTDYVVNYSTDRIRFVNSSAMYFTYTGNLTGVSYRFTTPSYIDNAPARVFTGLIPLFFVIALLVAVLIYLKKGGVFDNWLKT